MGFLLGWGLLGKGSHSMIGYLHEFYLGGRRSRVGLKLQLHSWWLGEGLFVHVSPLPGVFGFCLCLDMVLE